MTPNETTRLLQDDAPSYEPTTDARAQENAPTGEPAEVEAQDDAPTSKPLRDTLAFILLALPIGGLQVAWSVQFSAGSSYLLSLGMSKPLLAAVWFAGPLAGIVVQPCVGALSDGCRLPYGRRRPYLLGGTAVTVFSMMVLLAWGPEFVGLSGGESATAVKAVTVAGVYTLNAGLNIVEASAHAFITDCAPGGQQEAANGMASRSIALGNLLGFLAGSLDLALYLPFLGGSHFKVLCAVSSVTLVVTVLVGAWFVTEVKPTGSEDQTSVWERLWDTIRDLSPQIRTLFVVQIFACFAFFPILFYASVYVAEIYVGPCLRENPNMTPEELDVLYVEGTRKGSTALLLNAVVMLVSTVVVPVLVTPTFDQAGGGGTSEARRSASGRWLVSLQIPWLTLKVAWVASLALQAAAMLAAPFVQSVGVATALIAVLGYPWALSAWAPFAIIGAETSRPDGANDDGDAAPSHSGEDASNGTAEVISTTGDGVGTVFGIHNMVMCIAQAFSTIVSLGIFKHWQKPRGEPGDPSFALLFWVSGLATVAAAYFALRIEGRPGGQRV
ncbi:related to sucrose transporter SUT1D [Cephalotrichum gorgonifer]|uniref:Related to sucrose transporter SUT1D n=1 Tax=Cephalotrichum gorgonifer TaxID=2041049 RepID=A0AAE8SVS6_9PEZI|nr:related to sucrose transporter SUT1D [Cephalotrichum gorgonifer]